MTTTVFLSGSRSITRLCPPVRERLENLMQRAMPVIIGDANGADKALQLCLTDAAYEPVTIFAAGDRCRNNLGAWEIRFINTGAGLKGRDFYAQKDKAMAKEADYGFVLWDGKSAGSIGNALELVHQQKPAVIWFAPEKAFHTIKTVADLEALLNRCDRDAYRDLDRKIHLDRALRDMRTTAQPSLAL
jgi:hypothetical protein